MGILGPRRFWAASAPHPSSRTAPALGGANPGSQGLGRGRLYPWQPRTEVGGSWALGRVSSGQRGAGQAPGGGRASGAASVVGTASASQAPERLTCPTGYSLPPSTNGCWEREKATSRTQHHRKPRSHLFGSRLPCCAWEAGRGRALALRAPHLPGGPVRASETRRFEHADSWAPPQTS